MAVALDHLFRLVPNPGVDESLVHPAGRAVRAGRVAEHVPAAELLPLAPLEGAVEVVVDLVAGERPDVQPLHPGDDPGHPACVAARPRFLPLVPRGPAPLLAAV